MSRRNRPSAFEVSFGEKLPDGPAQDITLKRRVPNDASTSQAKRARRELPATNFYVEEIPAIEEDADHLVISGEEPGEPGADDKPVRILNDFTVFDPKHRMEMVSLQALEEDDGRDRHFSATGRVSAFTVDGYDDEDDEADPDEDLPFVRLGSVWRYSIDMDNENDPVWLETDKAWYILREPSRKYEPFFRHFYVPRRITQLVLSTAKSRPGQEFPDFVRRLSSTTTILGRSITEDDITSSITELEESLADHPKENSLRQALVVKHLLRGRRPSAPRKRAARWNGHPPGSLRTRAILRNLDYFVLQTENQTTTHVTPLIARLAEDHFGEQLIVVGAPLSVPSKETLELRKKKAFAKLQALVDKAHRVEERRHQIRTPPEYKLGEKSYWLRAVDIAGETFEVGDVVIVRGGEFDGKKMPNLPAVRDIPITATIPDFFWFARIIFLNREDNKAHVQWFEHSSFTAMEEFGNSQQLFLNNLCDPIPFHLIIEKVNVHYRPQGEIPPEDFFYRSVYNHRLADVVDIDSEIEATAATSNPPENCPVCLLRDQKLRDEEPRPLSNPDGIAYMSHVYHRYDFVLVLSDNQCCDMGQIIAMNLDPGARGPNSRSRIDCDPTIRIRCIGRINSLAEHLPPGELKDERHVFMTDEERDVRIKELIRPCFVLPFHDTDAFRALLKMSPDHFYIRYRFPSLKVQSWNQRQAYQYTNHPMCNVCVSRLVPLEGQPRREFYENFIDAQKRAPLRALDLFGGCGAFSSGMAEGAGFIKVTHAVEISPSAAKSFMRNSECTLMYNNCANIILRYFIKTYEGHMSEAPTQLFDGKTPVPAPLKPGSIDLITIGFPCQSHSGLNKYKKANDPKSNLILTALSYVDFLKPKYCYFENVRGFLQFNLGAVQMGQHRVVGGIEMGGLKFLMRALNELGYQYRFALLQAAHYGAPQARIRFFLIAARQGNPLPELPQPSHYFPLVDSLSIKFPIGAVVTPITQTPGSIMHPFVTIDDAISDLPRFDWRHPNPHKQSRLQKSQDRERERSIPALPCRKDKPWCGFSGRTPYFHEPRTSYQVQCRVKETKDLQQYTKVFLPATVERVLNVPLQAHADYRSLKPDQHEWQISNPLSAVARGGYRGGPYARLDKDGWFSTTVGNVNPTAKQSRILNPYCKRIVTIRELARSQGFPDHFIFEAIDDNLITMHRQIGNAVPWPVSKALGHELGKTLFQKWLADRRGAIWLDD